MAGTSHLRTLQALLPQRAAQLWYVPLAGTAMVLMFARLLLYAAWLDAPQFAVLSAGLLVSGLLGMLACLGLQPLAQRDFPILAVKGRSRAGVVLLLQSAQVAVVLTLLGGLATLAGAAWPGLSRGQAQVALLHGLAQQLFLLYTVESRSHGKPITFAWQSLARASTLVAAGGLAAWSTRDATSTLLAETLACTVVMAFLTPSLAQRNRIHLWPALVLAIRRMPHIRWQPAGLLLAAGALAYLQTSADRWVANSVLGPEGFAAYSFAWILLLAAGQAQVIINSAAFPWMARRVARAGSAAAFASTSLLSILTLLLGAVTMVPVLLMAYWAVPLYWPHLAASVRLLPLFAICAVLRVSDFWSSFLVVSGNERRLLASSLIGTVVVLGVALLLLARQKTPLTPLDVAWLPVLLTVAAYTASLLACLGAPKVNTC